MPGEISSSAVERSSKVAAQECGGNQLKLFAAPSETFQVDFFFLADD